MKSGLFLQLSGLPIIDYHIIAHEIHSIERFGCDLLGIIVEQQLILKTNILEDILYSILRRWGEDFLNWNVVKHRVMFLLHWNASKGNP